MKRDPSIHVRRSSLTEALEEILVHDNAVSTVRELFHKLDKEAIRNRVVIKPTAAAKKKMTKVASVDKALAESFHAMYQQVNLQNNIRTTIIKATDGKYATLKEVAFHAREFCKMFDLSEEHGFQIYITIGIRLAKNQYSIYKLKALGDRIIHDYQNILDIDNDEDKAGTSAFYAAWKNVSIKYIGMASSVTEPYLFVHFIHGRKAADATKADYVDWISAQFEGLASMNATPSLQQLSGDNATLRYTKYIGVKSKEYKSNEEKTYFEKSRVVPKKIKRKRGSKEA